MTTSWANATHRRHTWAATILVTALLASCESEPTPEQRLKTAVLYNDATLVQSLLQQNVDPTRIDWGKELPLNHALLHRSERVARLLLASNVDPNRPDSDGRPAIAFLSPQFRLAQSGPPTVVFLVIYLLSTGYACASELSPETVELVLAKTRDPDGLFPGLNSADTTALAQSASCGHIATMSALLAHGAHVNKVLPNGVTALGLAAAAGNVAATQRLLENSADANARDANSVTPLMLAAREASADHARTIELLLAHNAAPNAQDARGETALMYAVRVKKDATPSIRALVAAGANPDLKNHQGESARSLRNSSFN